MDLGNLEVGDCNRRGRMRDEEENTEREEIGDAILSRRSTGMEGIMQSALVESMGVILAPTISSPLLSPSLPFLENS